MQASAQEPAALASAFWAWALQASAQDRLDLRRYGWERIKVGVAVEDRADGVRDRLPGLTVETRTGATVKHPGHCGLPKAEIKAHFDKCAAEASWAIKEMDKRGLVREVGETRFGPQGRRIQWVVFEGGARPSSPQVAEGGGS